MGLSFPQSAMGDGEHRALELPLASASPGVAGLVCPGTLHSSRISCFSLSLPSPSHRALPGAAGDELTGGQKAWACFISSLGSGHQGQRAGQRSPAVWSRPERPDAAKSARKLGNTVVPTCSPASAMARSTRRGSVWLPEKRQGRWGWISRLQDHKSGPALPLKSQKVPKRERSTLTVD